MTSRRAFLLVVVPAVLIGPVLGWLAHRLTVDYERQRALNAFRDYVSLQVSSLEAESSALFEVLYSLRSSFETHADLTRAEFRTITESSLARYPAIQALEWVPRVPRAERDAYEKQARQDGLPRYRISVRTPAGDLTPSPNREEYHPVYYVEPLRSNATALGYDLGSDPERRATLARAARSGRLTLTPPLQLVQDGTPTPAYLAVLPIHGSSTVSTAPDRAPPRGYVGLVLGVSEVISHSMLLGIPHRPEPMNFQVSARDDRGHSTLLYSSNPREGSGATVDAVVVRQVDIGGVTWRLTATPTVSFWAIFDSSAPLAAGLSTVLIWWALMGLVLAGSRWQASTATRRQDRLFRSVSRNLADGYVIADTQGRILFANDAMVAMVGARPGEMTIDGWCESCEYYLPDGRTRCPREELPLIRTIQGERVSDAEMFLRSRHRPEGLWTRVNGYPLRDERGRLEGGIVVMRDITERKQAEARQAESVKQLNTLKQALDQAALVTTIDSDGKITHVNDKLCESTGYAREELIGRSHRLLTSGHQSDPRFADMWKTIMGGGMWQGEVCDTTKDGRKIWTYTTILPMPGSGGEPAKYLAIRWDITDAKADQESVLQLSSALEQAADIVFITDAEGKIEYVNRGFEITTGYTKDEVIGKTPRVLKSGAMDAEFYEQLWRTVLAGEVFKSRSLNRKKSGELYSSEQTVTPLKDASGKVVRFVSVAKDMTERLQREGLELEMRVASAVQKRLYPQSVPSVPGADIAGAVLSAAATCGDYYDYVPLGDGRIGIAVGDVTGHGLGPALVMSETRVYLRAFCETARDPGALLTTMNERLAVDLDEGYFVTLVFADIDVAAKRLTYANAGHPAAYVLDANGDLKAELESTGLPLGIRNDEQYPCGREVALEPSDTIVFLTDGVLESRNAAGDQFGAERTLAAIRACQGLPARETVERVSSALREFTGAIRPVDDITLVVCKLAPTP